MMKSIEILFGEFGGDLPTSIGCDRGFHACAGLTPDLETSWKLVFFFGCRTQSGCACKRKESKNLEKRMAGVPSSGYFSSFFGLNHFSQVFPSWFFVGIIPLVIVPFTGCLLCLWRYLEHRDLKVLGKNGENLVFTWVSTQNIGGFPPKWMVKIREPPIKIDDLGVPLFLETPISGW